MCNRSKKTLLYVAAVAIVIFVSSFAQDFEKVQIKTTKVSDGVYMLTGSGGNIGVSAGNDGVLLVDDQFAELTEKIRAAIAKINGGPIRFVLNTNWHYDHVGGNRPLAEAGCIIIAHDNSRKLMMAEQYHPFFDMRIPPYPEAALPKVTFTESITFHFNGDEIHAFHIENAHSDADIVIYFRKANVIHTGDILFVGGYPFIDIPHGGSIDGMIAAVDRLLGLINDNTKVIPGHGALSDSKGLQEYMEMLVTVKERVELQIKEGKTLEEIIASKPTSDFDKGRNNWMPSEGFVKIVYNDISKR